MDLNGWFGRVIGLFKIGYKDLLKWKKYIKHLKTWQMPRKTTGYPFPRPWERDTYKGFASNPGYN